MYIKTEGIILRETKYKDHDKLLTVLTKELGKVTVRVREPKGMRGGRSASTQFLAYSEFTLLERQGRYSASEVNLIELFLGLREDLELFSLASYFAQVCDVAQQEEDPNEEVLSLLLNCLFALAKLRKPQESVKAVFELRLMSIIGFLPDLRGCVTCGKLTPDRFNITLGALQCSSCAAGESIRLPLGSGTLAAMRYLTTCDAKRLFSFRLSEESLRELSHITESYLSTQLERGFSTLDFYKSLFL